MGGAFESRSEALVDGYAPESKATVQDSILPGDQVDETPENSGGNARPVIPAKQFADYMAMLDAGRQIPCPAGRQDGFDRSAPAVSVISENRLRPPTKFLRVAQTISDVCHNIAAVGHLVCP